MSLFITTRTTVNRHGVFVEEKQSPLAIQAQGTGVVGLVGQFPWGPDDQIIVPTDSADRLMTLAPPGMDHTGSGWMCVQGKPWPDLRIARVLGSAAAKAQVNLAAAGPTTIATLIAKYKGAAGNSIVGVVSNASDGNVNHFDLAVSVSGASGTTTDYFQNLDFSAGQPTIEGLANARLVGAITWVANGRPVNGTYNLAGGANGTINVGRYLGTPGNADLGLALFEGDSAINFVLSDDPGNTDRVAVNAGLQAHQVLKGDRIAILNGDSGLSPAAVQSAVSANRGTGIAWVDCWFYQNDDVDGTQRLVAPACALAVVMANLPPSTSPAWKDTTVQTMLSFIRRLEFNRGEAAGNNTLAGICTLIQEEEGGFTFEAAVNTAAPVTPTKKRLTRTRMGIYIAKALRKSLRPFVDAPNVKALWNDELQAVQVFMQGLKDNASINPIGLAHVVDWGFNDLNGANAAADIANGDFTIPLWAQTSSGQERIFISFEYGENVSYSVTL